MPDDTDLDALLIAKFDNSMAGADSTDYPEESIPDQYLAPIYGASRVAVGVTYRECCYPCRPRSDEIATVVHAVTSFEALHPNDASVQPECWPKVGEVRGHPP